MAESRRLFDVEMGEKRTLLEEEWSKRAEQLMQDIGVRETNLTHNQETNDATHQHRLLKVTLGLEQLAEERQSHVQEKERHARKRHVQKQEFIEIRNTLRDQALHLEERERQAQRLCRDSEERQREAARTIESVQSGQVQVASEMLELAESRTQLEVTADTIEAKEQRLLLVGSQREGAGGVAGVAGVAGVSS